MTISPPDLDHRGETRSVIIAAATGLLRTGGVQAVTTRAVAEAAGVPAPTIFRQFGDKAGLLDAVAEQVMADYVADKAVLAAGEDGDPVADLRAAWDHHVDFGLANPDLFALLSVPTRRPRSAAADVGIDVLTARVTRLATAGRLRVPVARAVALIHAAGTGVVLALAGQPVDARDTGLAEASFDAVLGAILAATPVPAAGDVTALAVTFAAAVPDLPGLTAAEGSLLREWLDRVVAAGDGKRDTSDGDRPASGSVRSPG
jgi:AcrR family transcriptional regulator